MKLSEAILLGSTQLRLEPMYWMCEDGGCLLGQGGYAMGLRYEDGTGTYLMEYRKLWPWIDSTVDVPAIAKRQSGIEGIYAWVATCNSHVFFAIISHLAGQVKQGIVTLEEVLDWVRSVEPEEPVSQEDEIPSTLQLVEI